MSDTENPIHPRKIEILHAAVTCFLERGYHQTGVRDIAKQAGISLGNLYNHFKGKDAVLAFIAELEGAHLAKYTDLLTNPEDPRAALEKFIDEYATHVARPENALLGVEILTEALRNPMIAEVFSKNRSRLIDALVGLLNTGAKSGIFRSQDDQRAVACMILDTLEGQGLRQLSQTTPNENSLPSICSFILNGLRV